MFSAASPPRAVSVMRDELGSERYCSLSGRWSSRRSMPSFLAELDRTREGERREQLRVARVLAHLRLEAVRRGERPRRAGERHAEAPGAVGMDAADDRGAR